MTTDNTTPADLILAREYIYNPCNYSFSEYLIEKESVAYNACTFLLNNLGVHFRTAKTTPAKTGQFVTLWRRDAAGITQPYRDSDPLDLVVISVRKEKLLGQFVFSKAILLEKGILSTPQKEGKRGFRVYPPWDLTTNRQAQKTQAWQLDFFLEIKEEAVLNRQQADRLYL